MDDSARFHLVAFKARIADPVGQAIAAEAGQTHQIDVLRIMPILQMVHQPAKGGGGHGIVQRVYLITFVHISANRPWFVSIALPYDGAFPKEAV